MKRKAGAGFSSLRPA